MKKKYIHFSLIACALCVGFLSTAIAAPSVKRLGGKNTYTGATSAVSAKTGKIGTSVKTNSGSRLSSVRTNRLINTNKTSSVKSSTSGIAANTSRLSVGQYLHNAGVVSGKIKPISGSSITPSEISDLTVRVENLEINKADKNDIENNYVTKNEIQNNYYTTEEITNNYATKTEVDSVSDTVSNIDTRLSAVEQTTGSSAGTVDDWNANKPSWAN
jgi:hypothetical protein